MTIRMTKLNGAPKTDPAPTKSQNGGLDVTRRDPDRINLQQKVDDRSDERQNDERGQERPQPEVADEEAIDQADQRADADRRRDRRSDRPLRDIDQRERGHIGEREVRADAQIDPAGQHDDRHADHDQTEFADLARVSLMFPAETKFGIAVAR